LSSSSVLLYPPPAPSPPPPQAAPAPVQGPAASPGRLASIIGFYPAFLLRFTQNILAAIIYLSWSQLLLAGPTLWLSAWLWIVRKLLLLPLSLVTGVLSFVTTPAAERGRRRRTVLISGGSSVQAIHLARNFHCAGARVVVVELEGLFGLARFSTAVAAFHTVAAPKADRPEEYVRALCEIAEREGASFYVPVCSSSPAYFDALAKPTLELLGCSVFCPSPKDTAAMDDALELLRRCRADGLPAPAFYSVASRDDVLRLYENGSLRGSRFWLLTAERKVALPPTRHEFRASPIAAAVFNEAVTPRPTALVLQDVPGEQLVTCTTVRDGSVLANVTCRLQRGGGLVPEHAPDVDRWLEELFGRTLRRPMSGHFRLRLVRSAPNGAILPLGCRVGVPLPYICHTSVHPRLLVRPCRHFSRQASGPLVVPRGRYWMHEVVLEALRKPGVESVARFVGTVLDRREALFVYWDPLPYCAYYHVQLPAQQLLAFVQGRPGTGMAALARSTPPPVR